MESGSKAGMQRADEIFMLNNTINFTELNYCTV